MMSSPSRPQSATAAFQPSLRAGSESRRHFAPIVDSWDRGALQPDVDLVLSELVANAVAYGRGPITVSFDHDHQGMLRIEVASAPGDAVPARGAPEPVDERGRGLQIVEAVADDWGFVQAEGECRVWVDLDVGRRSN